MNRRILLSYMAACFACIAFAAGDPDIFPTDNAIWVQREDIDKEIYYAMKGDTLINDTLYSKLYYLEEDTIIPSHFPSYAYMGGIRQEELKVYFRASSNYICRVLNKEILLYDFSETVTEVYHNGYKSRGGCFQSDAQYNSSRENETSMWSAEGVSAWYKGIGSDRGLFFPICVNDLTGYQGGYSSFQLLCLKVDGEVKYMNRSCGKCFEEACPIEAVQSAYMSNCVSVTYDKERQGIFVSIDCQFNRSALQIVDTNGKTVYQTDYTESFISTAAFASGVYMITVKIDGKHNTHKIYVTR
ncbi:MAG: T9SS type A sorting domain-containing protein [Bacteroidia bacterium]|nr:T9SS type A sorting domain-containing protein [Bacteroidia bacterium]